MRSVGAAAVVGRLASGRSGVPPGPSQPALERAGAGDDGRIRLPPEFDADEFGPPGGMAGAIVEDDVQQRRTTAEWNEEACQALNDAVRLCFPDGTPAEEMPAEIRELLVEQRWQRGGLDVRVRLTPALLRALRTLGHVVAAGSDTGAAQAWRPWRSYAVHHLWATLEAGAEAEEIAS